MYVALGYSHWGYRCLLLWGIHIGVIDVCCFGVFTLGLHMYVALVYSHWDFICILLWCIHTGVIDVCCFCVFRLRLQMYLALVYSHVGYKFLSAWTSEYVDITWVVAAFMGLYTLSIFLCQVIFTVSGPGLADVCQVIFTVSGPGLADVYPGASSSEIGTLNQLPRGQPYR